ncbi:MAG: hypothetical protein QNI91_00775 [Arenicellales bacterium]|nr:hypothetical protein [Arenicellales bacterium]
MSIELDHFFILTTPGAPQAELLSEIGLTEGSPNDHPGQGTANRRFFFSNSMLELIYIRDAAEAASGPGSQLRFVERANDVNASPFGLVFKAIPGSAGAIFPGWRYYPDYLETGRYLYIGQNSDILEEPLCVCITFDLPLSTNQPLQVEPYTMVTELRIGIPVLRPSSVLETITQSERVSLQLGEPHRLEVVFNEEQEGQFKDFRSGLPLIMRW